MELEEYIFGLLNRLLELVWSVLIDQLLSEVEKVSAPVRNELFSSTYFLKI
jgi:hypothetical protein